MRTPDQPAGDPAELLALVEAEQTRAARAIEPDPRILYGAWGAAWLIGFLASWLASEERTPRVSQPVAGTIFALCMVAAIVVTMVHIARRTAGVRGVSSRVGAMYGWAWLLSLLALAAIMTGAYRAGVPDETGALLWCVLSGLVVGALYLAGGALWQDRIQYGLGAWILVSSAAGAFAGYPGVYLVMGLAGGGGFLLAAAFFAVRCARVGRSVRSGGPRSRA